MNTKMMQIEEYENIEKLSDNPFKHNQSSVRKNIYYIKTQMCSNGQFYHQQ